MPSGKSSKSVRNARSAMVVKKPKPWGTMAAALAVLLFAGGVFGYAYWQSEANERRESALAPFTPSAQNQDPSRQIEGVVVKTYQGRQHVTGDQRVAYDESPPLGGPHDGVWAACNGVVYDEPVRTENMVHSLEHGAVWITYNPDKISPEELEQLRARVQGEQYIMMSPYPGLDAPISLQSWGHQLRVDSADDPRIDQFIRALRQNQYTVPETGATCDAIPGRWNTSDPPPFVAEPPGPGAVQMDQGVPAAGEMGQPPAGQPPVGQPSAGGS